uniref:Protein kinase domain-containing protein n=1 Tax=Steinernema glaseri TaxID=37863 RepID=A0A1I7ZIL8_9BILA
MKRRKTNSGRRERLLVILCSMIQHVHPDEQRCVLKTTTTAPVQSTLRKRGLLALERSLTAIHANTDGEHGTFAARNQQQQKHSGTSEGFLEVQEETVPRGSLTLLLHNIRNNRACMSTAHSTDSPPLTPSTQTPFAGVGSGLIGRDSWIPRRLLSYSPAPPTSPRERDDGLHKTPAQGGDSRNADSEQFRGCFGVVN